MKRKVFALFLFTNIAFAIDKHLSQKELNDGNALLLMGKFSDALSHYHKSIEYDPANYQAIYRRATTYLAIGHPKPGLVDLNAVLEQKPDFSGARQQRAYILLKLGHLDEAAQDFQNLKNHGLSNNEITEKLELIVQQKHSMDLLRNSYVDEDCKNVVDLATHLMEEQLWNTFLYQARGSCYKKTNNLKQAVHDLRHASKLSADNTELLYEVSQLQYKMTDIRDALSTTRSCLKIDPDHKKCHDFYKLLRKTVKSLDSLKTSIESQRWSKCLQTGETLLKAHKNDLSVKLNVFRLTCQCNREEGNIGAAIDECNKLLEHDDSDVEVLIQRAETYMIDEEYDLAIADYQKAADLDSSNEAAKSGLEQAKRAKELIGKRDYYKILGVKRSANKREITKAYRKMAQKWHPDNFSDEKEKKKAEKKFIDIASAKEVLSDEEKRRAFDNGQDPLDPVESQGRGNRGGFKGFNPFNGGGNGDFFFHF